MTERGLPIADGAPACPFVAFDDARDDRADHPDPRHRCYAESPPSPRARAHQEAYCLSANFPVCPTFQDWARREAARVLPTAAGGTPAERLRDVPAQRVAGERPAAFGPGGASSDGPAGRPGTGAAPGATAAGGLGAVTPGAGISQGAATSDAPAGGPPTVIPPAASESDAGAVLDRLIGQHDDAGHGTGDDHDDPGREAPREPWDLPTRRPIPPEWTAPPPWAAPRPARSDDVDAPEFLRAGSNPVPRDARPLSPETDDDADGPDSGSAATREATMARLRAMGMGGDAPDDDDAPVPRRPASGMGRRPGAEDAPDAESPGWSLAPGGAVIGSGGAGLGTGASAAPGDVGAAAGAASAGGPSRGLGRLLGWDRRPKAGSSRATRAAPKEPAWERPRRFEAYPTLKTRVGFPLPSRLWLAAGAVVVAALLLFFVPPLFLKQGAGTGVPGATRTPLPSGSGAVASSPARSVGPTARPSPTQQTYTVKQGDTLSTIAKKFHLTVDQLLAANKNIKNPNKIAIGDVIIIPSAAPSVIVDGGAPSPT